MSASGFRELFTEVAGPMLDDLFGEAIILTPIPDDFADPDGTPIAVRGRFHEEENPADRQSPSPEIAEYLRLATATICAADAGELREEDRVSVRGIDWYVTSAILTPGGDILLRLARQTPVSKRRTDWRGERKLITFYRPSGETNDYGEPKRTWPENWTLFAQEWAKVEPISGQEDWIANQNVPAITRRVTCRFTPGVTSAMRIVFSGRVFNIVSVVNVNERSALMQILCFEEPLSVV